MRNVTKEASQEELEEILLAGIEPIDKFLQIYWKVIL